jgi:hypothetical protein
MARYHGTAGVLGPSGLGCDTTNRCGAIVSHDQPFLVKADPVVEWDNEKKPHMPKFNLQVKSHEDDHFHDNSMNVRQILVLVAKERLVRQPTTPTRETGNPSRPMREEWTLLSTS